MLPHSKPCFLGCIFLNCAIWKNSRGIFIALSNTYDGVFMKIIKSCYLLTIFSKNFIIDVWQGSKYVSVMFGFVHFPKIVNGIRFFKKQPLDVFCKNFWKFTGKHLCWTLFLTKLQACRKETLTQVFFC